SLVLCLLFLLCYFFFFYIIVFFCFFFFFSSRRRHTRFSRDWSSDVCSSDLTLYRSPTDVGRRGALGTSSLSEVSSSHRTIRRRRRHHRAARERHDLAVQRDTDRSEERRVGKECKSRWATEHENKKKKRGEVN